MTKPIVMFLEGPSVKTARSQHHRQTCFFSSFKVYSEDSKPSKQKGRGKKKIRGILFFVSNTDLQSCVLLM